MGRTKPLMIKRITHELMETHSDKFSNDYKKNKEILKGLVSTDSKKLMNVMAGYVTRLVRKRKEADTNTSF